MCLLRKYILKIGLLCTKVHFWKHCIESRMGLKICKTRPVDRLFLIFKPLSAIDYTPQDELKSIS